MIKSIISGCTVLTLSALAVTHAEFSFEQELQQGCNKVKQYASLGKKNYDQKQYKKALENFQNQASWTAFCKANADETTVKFTDRDIEVANNNVGLAYAKLGQHFGREHGLCSMKNQNLVSLILSNYQNLKHQMTCLVNMCVIQVLANGITSW